jgi:hypothetical protein
VEEAGWNLGQITMKGAVIGWAMAGAALGNRDDNRCDPKCTVNLAQEPLEAVSAYKTGVVPRYLLK